MNTPTDVVWNQTTTFAVQLSSTHDTEPVPHWLACLYVHTSWHVCMLCRYYYLWVADLVWGWTLKGMVCVVVEEVEEVVVVVADKWMCTVRW